MSFRVCTRDEYGQTANVSDTVCDNVEEAVALAKKAVTRDNINNALTLDEKRRQWTSCYVELVDEEEQIDDAVVYAGKGPGAKDMVYMFKEAEVEQVPLSSTDGIIRLFIGAVSEFGKKENWFAEDTRKRQVDSLSSQELEGKTVYYVRFTP